MKSAKMSSFFVFIFLSILSKIYNLVCKQSLTFPFAFLSHEHHLLESHPEFSGEVHTRLDRHDFIFSKQYIRAFLTENNSFMYFKSDSVSKRMSERFLDASFSQDIARNCIESMCADSFLYSF